MKPISGPNRIAKIITRMTKADAMEPIIALEAAVVAGRTYQAYKRGKGDEARERFIEESIGSIVWLCGVDVLNRLGDKILAKILKTKNVNFDVATDKKLRTPFDNYIKKVNPNGFSKKQVALLKGAKVLTSVLLTNLFIGFVVPKVNQGLTKKLTNERKQTEKAQNNNNPAFKGGAGLAAINKFTSWIENTNTGKLLSSDAGIAGGRMYNARTKEERREIAIRDIGSIYFYMWAQGHTRNLLNLVQTGKATRLNPEIAEELNKYLINFVDNKEFNVTDFKKSVLGDSNIKLPENIKFEATELSRWQKITKQKPLEVIKLSELEKLNIAPEILARARKMSKLQPERIGEAVLTKQQLIDSFNKAEINNPELLNKIFTKFTKGNSIEEFKFVSNKDLYNLKSEMENYVEQVCKEAKGGKVTKELLEKYKKKNLMYNGINFVAGFALAALFLSTLIPKFQYYFTRKTTGVDAFPGLYDYEADKKKMNKVA